MVAYQSVRLEASPLVSELLLWNRFTTDFIVLSST